MKPDELSKLTDKDLPPSARTEANLWRAKAWEYYAELVKANKGLRRLRFNLHRFQARCTIDAAEIERLRAQLAEWEEHVKGAFEHFFPGRDFGQSPPWQRADMLVSHCHDLEKEIEKLQEEVKYLTHTDKPPYRAVEHRRRFK